MYCFANNSPGTTLAATLLAVLPEIGALYRKEVPTMAGVAPYNRDSSTFRGQRHICGGRKRLRATTYMAAVCARHSNAHLAEFYNRLVNENHRPKKLALTAVMRKMLITANAAVKDLTLGFGLTQLLWEGIFQRLETERLPISFRP
jgi:transposase